MGDIPQPPFNGSRSIANRQVTGGLSRPVLLYHFPAVVPGGTGKLLFQRRRFYPGRRYSREYVNTMFLLPGEQNTGPDQDNIGQGHEYRRRTNILGTTR